MFKSIPFQFNCGSLQRKHWSYEICIPLYPIKNEGERATQPGPSPHPAIIFVVLTERLPPRVSRWVCPKTLDEWTNGPRKLRIGEVSLKWGSKIELITCCNMNLSMSRCEVPQSSKQVPPKCQIELVLLSSGYSWHCIVFVYLALSCWWLILAVWCWSQSAVARWHRPHTVAVAHMMQDPKIGYHKHVT